MNNYEYVTLELCDYFYEKRQFNVICDGDKQEIVFSSQLMEAMEDFRKAWSTVFKPLEKILQSILEKLNPIIKQCYKMRSCKLEEETIDENNEETFNE